MSIGLFGKKLGMTRIFTDDGISIPVTFVKVETCQVSQIKTIDTDGYNAVQVSYIEQPLHKLTKPQTGHFKKSGTKGFRYSGEFLSTDPNQYKLGQTVGTDIFSFGQKVNITGRSIGKGFSGNQKRHNFSRGPMTHGSKNHRLPGSIGAGSTPGRVYPGKKMAGQLGNKKVTITNSEVVFISQPENIIVLKGSLPGKKENILRIAPNE
jgi:large subunit ribosomal protein L3